ncbi:DUF1571 domain-containing protein [Planctomicrobium sp.]|nr:DUF1571 domain-containing protein [bacterium]MDB4439642.1 DUF1571 domain-containing protein [Planctomicrobium sp.]
MSQKQNLIISRRRFLTNSVIATSTLGVGILVGDKLFADPTKIAMRVKDAPATHPLTPALQLGTASLKALEEVKDYSATFTKREQIGRKMVDAQMEMKLRHDPFSVYMKFLKPGAGREVLYVEGENDNKIKAHDVGIAGLAGTLSLDVDGSFAMADNKYPITMAGMQTMAAQVLEQWLSEIKISDVNVNYYPKARIGQTACKAIETSHRPQAPGVKFSKTRLYVDASTNFPVRVQQYDFPKKSKKEAELVEDYLYTNIKTNLKLTDSDFSTSNTSYNF